MWIRWPWDNMAVGLPHPLIGRSRQENLGSILSAHRPARPVTWTRYLLLGMTAGLLAVAGACGDAAATVPPVISTVIPTASPTGAPGTVSTPTISPSPASAETPTTALFVRVDELVFPVELAANSEDRIRGLSGRASLDAGTGMLFVFEKAERFRFWMREMEFFLDIVWISAGCKVLDVSENVPFPDPSTPLGELPRYSPESKAKYVLEINGGEAVALGLGIGDTVEFLDGLAGRYGC